MKNLLHIVDMQRDFVLVNGKLAVPGATSLIRPSNEFIKTVSFDKTIATFDTHYSETYSDTNEAKMFPPHCLYGTWGWQSAINMANYVRILKNQFDVWEKPHDIEQALKGFTPENTTVYIMGVASDFCVKYAINGYLNRGYSVIILQDLCCGINNQIDQVVKQFDKSRFNIKLIQSKQMYQSR